MRGGARRDRRYSVGGGAGRGRPGGRPGAQADPARHELAGAGRLHRGGVHSGRRPAGGACRAASGCRGGRALDAGGVAILHHRCLRGLHRPPGRANSRPAAPGDSSRSGGGGGGVGVGASISSARRAAVPRRQREIPRSLLVRDRGLGNRGDRRRDRQSICVEAFVFVVPRLLGRRDGNISPPGRAPGGAPRGHVDEEKRKGGGLAAGGARAFVAASIEAGDLSAPGVRDRRLRGGPGPPQSDDSVRGLGANHHHRAVSPHVAGVVAVADLLDR